MSANKDAKRPTKTYKLTDWQYACVKDALQGTAAARRKTRDDEEARPSVRAMAGASADEMQETLDDLRDQEAKT